MYMYIIHAHTWVLHVCTLGRTVEVGTLVLPTAPPTEGNERKPIKFQWTLFGREKSQGREENKKHKEKTRDWGGRKREGERRRHIGTEGGTCTRAQRSYSFSDDVRPSDR